MWRSWPGIILLYGALLSHLVLVLWALYSRRTLRVRPREGAQIVFGLALPFLLADHVLSTRGLNVFFGVEDNYIYEILILWVFAPDKGVIGGDDYTDNLYQHNPKRFDPTMVKPVVNGFVAAHGLKLFSNSTQFAFIK